MFLKKEYLFSRRILGDGDFVRLFFRLFSLHCLTLLIISPLFPFSDTKFKKMTHMDSQTHEHFVHKVNNPNMGSADSVTPPVDSKTVNEQYVPAVIISYISGSVQTSCTIHVMTCGDLFVRV